MVTAAVSLCPIADESLRRQEAEEEGEGEKKGDGEGEIFHQLVDFPNATTARAGPG